MLSISLRHSVSCFFFQAEDGIRYLTVTGVQTCALPISRVAYWLGAKPGEVIFTAGGTEANNLAIHGVMQQFSEGNIVVSGIEHESVLAPAHLYECREAPVGADGIADVAALIKRIDDQTVLVSVMYANNEVGTIQP